MQLLSLPETPTDPLESDLLIPFEIQLLSAALWALDLWAQGADRQGLKGHIHV